MICTYKFYSVHYRDLPHSLKVYLISTTVFCYGAADSTHQNEEKSEACDFPFSELDVRDGLLLPDQYVKGEYLHLATCLIRKCLFTC